MSTAVYLFIGLDDARRRTVQQDWPDNREGFMGVVQELDTLAARLDIWYEENTTLVEEYPGVFDYEVVEHLGEWLYEHMPTDAEAFLGEAKRFVLQQIEKG